MHRHTIKVRCEDGYRSLLGLTPVHPRATFTNGRALSHVDSSGGAANAIAEQPVELGSCVPTQRYVSDQFAHDTLSRESRSRAGLSSLKPFPFGSDRRATDHSQHARQRHLTVTPLSRFRRFAALACEHRRRTDLRPGASRSDADPSDPPIVVGVGAHFARLPIGARPITGSSRCRST